MSCARGPPPRARRSSTRSTWSGAACRWEGTAAARTSRARSRGWSPVTLPTSPGRRLGSTAVSGSVEPQGAAGRMAGRRALVTGGASGIGLATISRLLAEGARVVAVDRRAPRPDPRAVPAVPYLTADVSQPGQVTSAVREAADLLGGPADVLANAAGVYQVRPMLDLTAAEWDHTLAPPSRWTAAVPRSERSGDGRVPACARGRFGGAARPAVRRAGTGADTPLGQRVPGRVREHGGLGLGDRLPGGGAVRGPDGGVRAAVPNRDARDRRGRRARLPRRARDQRADRGGVRREGTSGGNRHGTGRQGAGRVQRVRGRPGARPHRADAPRAELGLAAALG